MGLSALQAYADKRKGGLQSLQEYADRKFAKIDDLAQRYIDGGESGRMKVTPQLLGMSPADLGRFHDAVAAKVQSEPQIKRSGLNKLWHAAQRGTIGMADALGETFDLYSPKATKNSWITFHNFMPHREVPAGAEKKLKHIREKANRRRVLHELERLRYQHDPLTNTGNYATNIPTQLAELVPKVTASATMGPAGATAFWLTQIAPDAYHNYRKRGMKPDIAKRAAFLSGFLQAILSYHMMRKMLPQAGLKVLGENVLPQTAKEVATEWLKRWGTLTGEQAARAAVHRATQKLAHIISPQVPDVPVFQILGEAVDSALDSAGVLGLLAVPGVLADYRTGQRAIAEAKAMDAKTRQEAEYAQAQEAFAKAKEPAAPTSPFTPETEQALKNAQIADQQAREVQRQAQQQAQQKAEVQNRKALEAKLTEQEQAAALNQENTARATNIGRRKQVQDMARFFADEMPEAAAELAGKTYPSRGDYHRAVAGEARKARAQGRPAWSPEDARRFFSIMLKKGTDREVFAQALRDIMGIARDPNEMMRYAQNKNALQWSSRLATPFVAELAKRFVDDNPVAARRLVVPEYEKFDDFNTLRKMARERGFKEQHPSKQKVVDWLKNQHKQTFKRDLAQGQTEQAQIGQGWDTQTHQRLRRFLSNPEMARMFRDQLEQINKPTYFPAGHGSYGPAELAVRPQEPTLPEAGPLPNMAEPQMRAQAQATMPREQQRLPYTDESTLDTSEWLKRRPGPSRKELEAIAAEEAARAAEENLNAQETARQTGPRSQQAGIEGQTQSGLRVRDNAQNRLETQKTQPQVKKGGLVQVKARKPTSKTYDFTAELEAMTKTRLAKLAKKAKAKRGGRKPNHTEAAVAKQEKVEAARSPHDPKYGEDNILVPKAEYQKASDQLIKKATRLHSGIPADALPDLLKVGLYHVEAGARTFAKWSKAMIREFGKGIKPHLRELWIRVKGQYDVTTGKGDVVGLLDAYQGNYDLEMHNIRIDGLRLQLKLRDIMGNKKVAKRADKAIFVNVDLRNAQERGFGTPAQQFAKWGKKLSPEAKALYAESQHLSKPLQKIAHEIIAHNRASALEAQGDAHVLKDAYDIYIERLWKPLEDQSGAATGKFKLGSRVQKQRVYESVLEGWHHGRELAIEGAIEAMIDSRQQLAQVILNRAFIDAGKAMGLLSVYPERNMELVRHPHFGSWERATSQSIKGKTYGPRLRKTKSGQLLQFLPLYARADLAEKLNNVFGESALNRIPGFKTFTKWANIIKANVLVASLFHPQAFLRVLGLTGEHPLETLTPWRAQRAGYQAMLANGPMLQELVEGGMTLGRVLDWEQRAFQKESTLIGRVIDRIPVAAPLKHKALNFQQAATDFIFQTVGAPFKAHWALLAYQKELIRRKAALEAGTTTRKQVAKEVGKMANLAFGGMNLRRRTRNPTLQHMFRLAALAPDWTETNARAAIMAFKPGAEGAMYRRFWRRVFIRGLGLTTALNMALASISESDEDKRSWRQRYTDNVKKAWRAGKFRWLMADITPVARMLGASPDRRQYLSIVGHFLDAFKMANDPARFIVNKMNPVTRVAGRAATGQDWAGRRYTTIAEQLGKDDKGVYRTTVPWKHRKGAPKGGKLKWKTVTWTNGSKGPITWDRLPSFVIAEGTGLIAIPAQEVISYYLGEQDGFDTIMGISGTMEYSVPEDRLKAK